MGGNANNHMGLMEVEIFALESKGQNVAKLKDVKIASNNCHNSNRCHDNLIDGIHNYSNGNDWLSNGKTTLWVTFDFPSTQNIYEIEIYNQDEYPGASYCRDVKKMRIEYKKPGSSDWTTLKDVDNMARSTKENVNNPATIVPIDNIAADGIRLSMLEIWCSGAGYLGLMEVEIWASSDVYCNASSLKLKNAKLAGCSEVRPGEHCTVVSTLKDPAICFPQAVTCSDKGTWDFDAGTIECDVVQNKALGETFTTLEKKIETLTNFIKNNLGAMDGINTIDTTGRKNYDGCLATQVNYGTNAQVTTDKALRKIATEAKKLN